MTEPDESPPDCDHPVEERIVETREVGGEQFTVEVCEVCNTEVPGEGAERVLWEADRGDQAASISVEEAILTLLSAQPRAPVTGVTKFMKEVFLFDRELTPELGIRVRDMEFYPHKFGPLSDDVYEALDQLDSRGLIDWRREEDDQGADQIRLTGEGEAYVLHIIEEFDDDAWSHVRRKRRGWDQLPSRDLLRQVYRNYRPFTIESEITEDLGLGEEDRDGGD